MAMGSTKRREPEGRDTDSSARKPAAYSAVRLAIPGLNESLSFRTFLHTQAYNAFLLFPILRGHGASVARAWHIVFASANGDQAKGTAIVDRAMSCQYNVEGITWTLDVAPCTAALGIREARRIAGDYVLSVEDLRAGQAFDDAIARCVYALDGHKPDDDKRTYILPPEARNVPPHPIPFRSLLPREAGNLLTAGRCLSADQLSLSSARVMTTSSMMGQAAGRAAALAASRNCGLRSLDFAEIGRVVVERGARLDI